MATRTILGNVQNLGQQGGVAQGQGGKILQVANWLTGKVSGQNKENVVEGAQAQVTKGAGKTAQQLGVRRSNKRLCVEVAQPMEVDTVVPEKKLEEKSVPEGVIDIDKEEDDANACGEYARDIHAYLRGLEKEMVVAEGHLEGSQVTSKMRSLLVDWLVSVHHQFELAQETLFLTVNILDRYLELEAAATPRDQLQLVGTAALLLACKMEEIYLPSLEDFVYSTDNAYSEAQLRAMEVRMLAALNFDLNAPISLSFLRRYSKAGDVDVLEHTLAKYILELSLLDCGQASLPPSLAAASALLLSLQLLEPSLAQPWSVSLQHHSGYTAAELAPVVRRMAVVLTNCETHRLQSVRQKYSSRKYRRVALIRELGPAFIKRRVPLA